MNSASLKLTITLTLVATTVAVLASPDAARAQELKTVRNEALGFVVDLPGGSWIAMSTEEDSSSVNGLKGAAVTVTQRPERVETLDHVKLLYEEQATRSGVDTKIETFEHRAGPGVHSRSVGVGYSGKNYLAHGYWIKGSDRIYGINCRSNVATPQEEQDWDELCQAVLDSFELI